ncbi:MAG: hypothetical protein MRZ96_08355 [Clostridium sp.]|nr:hypothetical protein [Clostridium sp.]
MKKAMTALTAFIAAACLLMTSCSDERLLRSVDDLIVPPLYYDEYGGLVDTIQNDLGKDIRLCIPYEGDNRSAIIFNDIDGDGSEEAIVFYRTGKSESNARMHIYRDTNRGWVSGGDFSGYGSEVGNVAIDDMDLDGSKELLVLWNIPGISTGNVVSVYRSEPSELSYSEIANEFCSLAKLVDVDGDSYNELFFICYSNTDGVTHRFARVLKLSSGSIVLMGEARLDANVSSYLPVKTEKASDKAPLRIYVDALKGSDRMITELVYWDSSRSALVAPFFNPKTESNDKTLRHEQLRCADINNDGVIEIPVQQQLLGEKRKVQDPDYENVFLTRWVSYTDGSLKTAVQAIVNADDGYMVTLKDYETEYLGARYYPSTSCLIVYDEKSEGDNELFSVLRVSAERWSSGQFSSYIQALRNDDSVVCAYITHNGNDSGFNERNIKTRIAKFQQNGG